MLPLVKAQIKLEALTEAGIMSPSVARATFEDRFQTVLTHWGYNFKDTIHMGILKCAAAFSLSFGFSSTETLTKHMHTALIAFGYTPAKYEASLGDFAKSPERSVKTHDAFVIRQLDIAQTLFDEAYAAAPKPRTGCLSLFANGLLANAMFNFRVSKPTSALQDASLDGDMARDGSGAGHAAMP